MATRYGFFPKADGSSQIDYPSLINLIKEDKTLIDKLIAGINQFIADFENQSRSSSPKDFAEIEAGIERCGQRIGTLRNIASDGSVSEQEKQLLVDFIHMMQRKGVVCFPNLNDKLQASYEQNKTNLGS